MPPFVMPRLSDTMEEGTIVEWLARDGDQVEAGQEIVEIEGDKATMAVAAEATGALRIIVAAGETLPTLETIAWIGDEPPDGDQTARLTPTAAPAEPASVDPAPTPSPPGDGGRRVNASPVARRVAERHGLDLGTIAGSGPGGRIVADDVEAALAAGPEGARAAPPVSAEGSPQRVELSRTQSLIARRMAEAKATIPDFEVWVDVDMSGALALRERLRAAGGPPPSINDVIVSHAAATLREFPRLNASFEGEALVLHPEINVGVAVDAGEALLVPTVFGADRKSLAEIGAESRELVEAARAGRLTAAQMSGATFTVSNLGMFGVSGFRAIVTQSQAAILAVGAIERRVVAVGDAHAIRPILTATLSVDHRIAYGAEAARFLARLRERLEAAAEERQ